MPSAPGFPAQPTAPAQPAAAAQSAAAAQPAAPAAPAGGLFPWEAAAAPVPQGMTPDPSTGLSQQAAPAFGLSQQPAAPQAMPAQQPAAAQLFGQLAPTQAAAPAAPAQPSPAPQAAPAQPELPKYPIPAQPQTASWSIGAQPAYPGYGQTGAQPDPGSYGFSDLVGGRSAATGTPGNAIGSYGELQRLDDGYAGTSNLTMEAETGSAQTLGIWLIALAPLWFGGLAVAFLMFHTTLEAAVHQSALIVAAGFLVLALLACWLFAAQDWSALKRNGFHPASLGWMLLFPPLVYLARRGRAVREDGGKAAAPEAVFFISVLLLVGGYFAASFLVPDTLKSLVANSELPYISQPQDQQPTEQPAVTIPPSGSLGVITIPSGSTPAAELPGFLTSAFTSIDPTATVDCSASTGQMTPGSTFPCALTWASGAQTATIDVSLGHDMTVDYEIEQPATAPTDAP